MEATFYESSKQWYIYWNGWTGKGGNGCIGKGEKEARDEEEGQEMEELKEKEIREAKKMNKKAVGIDRIPMEAKKYAEGMLWTDIIEVLGQVWR